MWVPRLAFSLRIIIIIIIIIIYLFIYFHIWNNFLFPLPHDP